MRLLNGIVAFTLATATSFFTAGFAAAQPTTRLAHTPVGTFVPGSRILVWATAVDDARLAAFRCYFREAGHGDYGFVDMAGAGADRFVAFLPAPSPGTSAIEYVLLAVTSRREVLRSQTFTMRPGSATDETAGTFGARLGDQTARGEIFVSQDLPQPASSFPGFEGIVLRGIAPEQRFGQVVRGLYGTRRPPRDGWPADCRGYDVAVEAPAQPLPGVLPPPDSEAWTDPATTVGGDVSGPQAVKIQKPRYTAAAMRAKVQGTAVVQCIVETDGSVRRARVRKSLDPIFGLDFEALAAARQWTFTPAMRNGEPVAVAVMIELKFELR